MSDQPNQQKSDENSNMAPSQEGATGLHYLLRTLHVLFIALRVLIILVLLGVFVKGFFYVREDEKAMLFRFGKLVSKDGQEILTSEKGRLYWSWPYPVDRLERIPAEQSLTINTQHFWPAETAESREQPQAKPMLQVGKDGYVLTGDANIVHMIWSLTYRINNVKRYYLGFVSKEGSIGTQSSVRDNTEAKGVRAVIENALCNAVIREVGRWNVEDILVKFQRGEVRREGLTAAVEDRVQQLLAEVDAGIEVQNVSLNEFQPPVAVSGAFREVVDAANQYRRLIDTARQYKEETLAGAQAREAEILADAHGYKTQSLEALKAEANYFEDILEKYRERPDTTLIALYNDTLRRVLQVTDSTYVVHSRKTGQQEVRLRLGPPAVQQKTSEESPE